MPVWRVTVNAVEASRKEQVPGNVQIEVKPSVEKAKLEKSGKGGKDIIRTTYNLEVKYTPNVGSIKVKGDMILINEDFDKIADKKGLITDPEMVRQMYQRIFLEPMVLTIQLAKEMMLPMPVRMPEVKVEQK